MATAEDCMRRCIELARLAAQSGDTAVGSLISRDDQVLAEGIESVKLRLDVTAHAEIEAIRQACHALQSLDLRGCVLYTTAEPCWMCSHAIRQTGISQVVICAAVPWVGGATSNHPILTDAEIGCWPAPPLVVWSDEPGDCESLRKKQNV